MPCTSQETKLEVEAMLCTINFQVGSENTQGSDWEDETQTALVWLYDVNGQFFWARHGGLWWLTED